MVHKNLKGAILLLILFALTSACDKIENPHPPQLEFDLALFPGDPGDYPYPEFEASSNTIRNVLIEDFTGHKCVPCFAAAALAKEIEETNAPRVIVTSIHASSTGLFQSLDAEHPTDFTTEAGDEYVVEMIEGTFGGDNPLGTINRMLDSQTYGVPSVWQVTPYWTGSVAAQLNTELQANVQVEINYYDDTDGLFVHSRIDFSDDLTGKYHLVHYLIRKEVISPQSSPSGVVEDYEHHNVLTDNLNGTWGELIAAGEVSQGTSEEFQLSYQLPSPIIEPTFAAENLAVVSYVVNRDTYEILQVVITEVAE